MSQQTEAASDRRAHSVDQVRWPGSDFFGLWDVLGAVEEVALAALTGDLIDERDLELRLRIFGDGELPDVLYTTRVVVLAAAETRRLIGREDVVAPGSLLWSNANELEELASSAVANNLTNVDRPNTLSMVNHARLTRQVLGFIAGSVALMEARLELSVQWVAEALSALDEEERAQLQCAAEVVFWAAVFLISASERRARTDNL